MENYNQQNNPEIHPAQTAIIYQSELDYISRCIQDYPNIETGGQLFGFLTEYGAPVVCYAIGPGPQANHQPTFFNQDEVYLQETYNKVNKGFGLRYIGEWHSHHQLGLAKPSGYDAATVVKGMKKAPFRHFLLCIGNCDQNCNTTLNAFTFHLDHGFKYYHAPWKVLELDSPFRALIEKAIGNTLCNPKSKKANHGSIYRVDTGVGSMTTPDYNDAYWLNDKNNNVVLKRIIDFLMHYDGEACSVTPVLDGDKHVLLDVKRTNRQEKIVFGNDFPNEPPQIITTEEIRPEEIKWRFLEDTYEAFINYYKDLFSTNHQTTDSK